MRPQNPGPPPPAPRLSPLAAWSPPLGYTRRRLLVGLRQPSLWIAVGVGGFLAWAGTHLEILGLDDRPERSWGLILTTAETLGLLLVLSSRLRGADLAGTEGWADALKASTLGPGGLAGAETLAAAGAAWVGAVVCAASLLAFSIHAGPDALSLAGWGVATLVELGVLCAWLSLAVAWLGRLPGLGVAILTIVLGRVGAGGAFGALLPLPAPLPPGLPTLPGLAAGAAAACGLTALGLLAPTGSRTFD